MGYNEREVRAMIDLIKTSSWITRLLSIAVIIDVVIHQDLTRFLLLPDPKYCVACLLGIQ